MNVNDLFERAEREASVADSINTMAINACAALGSIEPAIEANRIITDITSSLVVDANKFVDIEPTLPADILEFFQNKVEELSLSEA